MVCAFPYIIAFTPDSMEIRLLVNGNLVHTVMMAELQLVTSKKDIYFVTTAPEFIPKGAKLRGPDSEDHELVKPRIEESKVAPEEEEGRGDGSAGRSRLSSDEDNGGGSTGAEESSGLAVTPQIQRAKSLQNSKPEGPGERAKDSVLTVDDLKRSMSKSNSYGEGGSSFTIPTTTCSKDLAKHFGAQPQPNTKNLCKHFGEASVPPNSPQNNTMAKGSSPSSPTRKSFIRQPTLKLSNSQQNEGETSPSNGNTKPLRIYRIPLTNLTGTHVQSHHYHYPSADGTAKKPTAIATKMQTQPTTAATTKPSTNDAKPALSSSREEDEDAASSGEAPVQKMSIFDQIQQDLQELSLKDKVDGTSQQQQQGDLLSSVLTPL